MAPRPHRSNLDRACRALRNAAASTRWYQGLRRWAEDDRLTRQAIRRAKRGMSKARRRIDRELEREEP
jgi:hypothetical protein